MSEPSKDDVEAQAADAELAAFQASIKMRLEEVCTPVGMNISLPGY
jgi:hypothetical protein